MNTTSIFALKNEMANQIINQMAANWGISIGAILALVAIVVIWELVWKLAGMWKAAKNGSVIWFVVLAIFNTVGILPILYIYVFSKWKSGNTTAVRARQSRTKSRRRR